MRRQSQPSKKLTLFKLKVFLTILQIFKTLCITVRSTTSYTCLKLTGLILFTFNHSSALRKYLSNASTNIRRIFEDSTNVEYSTFETHKILVSENQKITDFEKGH